MRNKPSRAADNKTYRYTFRLNEEQNTRFLQMMEEAQMTGNNPVLSSRTSSDESSG